MNNQNLTLHVAPPNYYYTPKLGKSQCSFFGLNKLYFGSYKHLIVNIVSELKARGAHNSMAMLEYDEIKERKYIVFNNEPWEVLTSHVFRKQQRKPVNATKLKNLITGKVTEQSFHVSEKVEEAEIDKSDAKYLYKNKGEFWFCEPNDPSKRFSLPEDTIGKRGDFLKTNSIIKIMRFGEQIIGVDMPIKVELKVTEAHPAVKGNTAQGGSKIVKVETGADVQVPMFIKEGEIIRINSETGEYAERVGGANF